MAPLVPCLAASLLVTLLASVTAGAQIRMSRIDPDSGRVTIQNFGASSVDVSSWQMCSGGSTYLALSTLTPIGSLDLASGADVFITYSLFVGAGDEVALYVSGPFTGGAGAANIRDYMQFNSTGGSREPVAVAAGLWGAGDAVTGDGPYLYTGDGTQNGVSFWELGEDVVLEVPAMPTWAAAGQLLGLASVAVNRLRLTLAQ
jgi:hypothetical protein